MKVLKIGILREVKNEIYYIEIENGEIIECKFSRKAKGYYKYDPSIDDRVQIELSPYGQSVGRIEPRGFVY